MPGGNSAFENLTYQRILEGRFIQEEVVNLYEGFVFRARALHGFDGESYTRHWFDVMGAASVSKGVWGKDDVVFEEDIRWGEAPVRLRLTIRILGRNSFEKMLEFARGEEGSYVQVMTVRHARIGGRWHRSG